MLARDYYKSLPYDFKTQSDSIKDLKSIGGCDEAKNAIMDVKQFIQHPQRYTSRGVRVPRGILFHGPPGTGKTLLGMAASKELRDVGAQTIFVNGSELVDQNIGAGAQRVRELF